MSSDEQCFAKWIREVAHDADLLLLEDGMARDRSNRTNLRCRNDQVCP